MKILVTGGGGFVGSHLVSSLLKGDNSVIVFDNLSKSSEDKINSLIKKGSGFFKGDITKSDDLNTCFSKHDDIDTIIHLAAKTRVIDSVKDPIETHHNNVTGSVLVFDVARKNDVKNIIVASSGAVYGLAGNPPFSENVELQPLSPYGASKLAMENYLKAFTNCYELNGIALRFANIYGKGQSLDYAGVISKFINNIKEKKPLTVFGDGESTRDFVSVEDIVLGIKLALKNIKGKKGKSYNLATGVVTSVNDLAKQILEISGESVNIEHVKPRAGEIRHHGETIQLAKDELGYKPKIELKQGLKKLFDDWN
jgi:UDP-glucose 4-epimerase